jgi:hypothetical protein
MVRRDRSSRAARGWAALILILIAGCEKSDARAARPPHTQSSGARDPGHDAARAADGGRGDAAPSDASPLGVAADANAEADAQVDAGVSVAEAGSESSDAAAPVEMPRAGEPAAAGASGFAAYGGGGGFGAAGAAGRAPAASGGGGAALASCQTDHDCATGQICALSGSKNCAGCTTDMDCQDDSASYGRGYVCSPSHLCTLLCTSCGGCEEIQPPGSDRHHTTDPIVYPDLPPSSGPHNPCWTSWGVHSTPVPVERWVHNLEHGGVIFLYHCPDGCAEEVATLTRLVGERNRTVLTEYGALPGRFGVVAWAHRLISDCVDPASFARFYVENYNHGPESSDAPPDPSCPP